MRTRTRLAALTGLAALWTAMGLADPTWACGCGAMVTSDSADLRVDRETSIVRYDERTGTEQIVMRLSVRSQAPDAAWLLPTPAPARVELGERSWFEQLDRLTEPQVVRRRHWWGRPGGGLSGDGEATAGAPPGAGVEVLGQRRLGPFQVATLASGDSRALARWLADNGYRLDDRLAEGLRPYVDRGWTYVAVKLAPEAGRRLAGELDPLHVSFRSEEIVYPMRLSRLARTEQAVHLYVLGSHRVEHQGPRGRAFGVTFAGWVEPRQVDAPGLRDFLGGRMFLTEVVNQRLRPESIDEDFRYRYTTDRTYREVEYEDVYLTFLGLPAGYAIVLGALAGAGAVAAAVTAARRRAAGR